MPPAHGRFLSSPELIGEYARLAEDAGFESIWVFEHAVIPAGYESRYPYNDEGRIGIEDADIPDPLALLAYLAGVTNELRLGTGVLLLPQRSAVLCAKEAATVDSLSGGRLELGIGVGWLREEADAVGTSFDDRGVRTDEAIEAMRVLWREPEASFRGKYTSFERAKCNPKPAQPGGVPIHVGGHSVAAARRAGRVGDGWFPIGLDASAFQQRRDDVYAAAGDAGRKPDDVEITYGYDPAPDTVHRYEELGVTRWILAAWGADLEWCKRLLGTLSDDVIAKFA
jgi:probable F420-dependent oxidoreductase